MNAQAVTLDTANNRRGRIAEITEILEQSEPELQERRGAVDTWKNKIASIQYVLDKENEPMPPHAVRYGRMSREEQNKKAAQIRDLQEQFRDAQSAYEPLRNKLAELTAERDDLENNPPAVTLADLKAAFAKIRGLSVKTEQIKQASEEAESKHPTDHINALAEEIETLSSELDLMAADVDMGTGSESDLKKLTAKLAKAKKEHTAAREIADLAQSTQRGYQRRLDALDDELADANAGFCTMLTLYAREGYRIEAERLKTAIASIEKMLCSMANFNALSRYKGDGSELSMGFASLRIESRGIRDLDNKTIEPDTDAALESAERILAGITDNGD